MLQIFYATSISLAKLSIMACYLRVFSQNGILCKIMLANGAVVVALFICSVLVTVFQCNPVQAAWDFQIQGAHCISIVDYFYVAATINGVTDLVLCFAPLPLVYKLKISMKEKVVVSLLFGLGFL